MSSSRSIADELSALRGQWNVVESTAVFEAINTQVLLAPANPLRYALVLPVISWNAVWDGAAINLTTIEGNVTNPPLIEFYYATNPILSFRDVGGLVQAAWYGWVFDTDPSNYPWFVGVLECLSVSGKF